MTPTTLYTRDHNNAVRVWSIMQTPGQTDHIRTVFGQLDGAMQTKDELVIPKSNRSLEEQITLQVNSKVLKKRDKGYVPDLNLLPSSGKLVTNQLGTHKPMLAQRIDKLSPTQAAELFNGRVVIQPKLDGNRCMITKRDGKVFAYSRNGKVIPADLSHITDPLIPILSEGMTLDGELYAHGETLQTIVSWIKKTRPETKQLRFHLYDLVSDESYYDRHFTLKALPLYTLLPDNPITLVTSVVVSNMDEVQQHHQKYLLNGYEGTIIRLNTTGYEAGKRSKSLLKLKSFMDDEYPVVNIHPSKDGWAVLECMLPDSNTFHVSAPGTIEDKKKILRSSHKYLGKMVHVEYANLTKDGVPFHPVATYFRNELT